MHRASRAFFSCVSLLRYAAVFTPIVFPPCSAQADITGYRLFKSAGYDQTSNAQPTSPTGFSADVDFFFGNSSDFASAEVTSPSPLSPMTLDVSSPGFAVFGRGYATAVARDVDFPASSQYEFQVSGGTLGTVSASLTTPAADLFALQVPYFTGSTYDQLQGMNPADAFDFTANGYTPPGGINTPLTFFSLTRVSDGQSVFGTSGTNALTSFVLPANTLEPETAYVAHVIYSARIATANAGFGSATSEVAFDYGTSLEFTTGIVPEPSSWLLSIVGAVGLLCYRRRCTWARRWPLPTPASSRVVHLARISILGLVLSRSILLQAPAKASVLDFETTPSGGLPVDDAILASPYNIPGGTVQFYFDLNGDNAFDSTIDDYPVFEHVGDDGSNGFASTFNHVPDTARPGYEGQLGDFFLRKPTDNTGPLTGTFIAQYNTLTPITELSGEIWDIDGTPDLGTERWRVDVLNDLNQVLATQRSPKGADDSSTSLDSLPWLFQFHDLPLGVEKVRLTFIGTKTTGLGLAFNNFSPVLAVPEPSTSHLWMLGLLSIGLWSACARGPSTSIEHK